MTQSDQSISLKQLKAEGAIQLAERESDLPPGGYVPSKRRSCSRCGEPVLISNGAFPLADHLPIVCRHCLDRGMVL